MNYKNLMAGLLLVAMGNSVYADTHITENTPVTSCAGKGSQCGSYVLGATGDVFAKIDIKGVPVNTFTTVGTDEKVEIVDAEKNVEVKLPQSPGDKVLYAVTFTKGETPNQKIDVLLTNLPERPGMPMKNMELKFLRRFSSDPEGSWTEVGNFGPSKTFKGKIGNTQITLKPDGTAVWTNQSTKKDTVFLVSKKDLKA